MTALLETVDLRKTYKVGKMEVEALRGVNIRIDAGEFTAIIGPSGSGKSTLMHLLGAMTSPTSGRVSIEGRDVAGMDDRMRTEVRRKSLGFVFQRFNLLPTLTARANIEVARWIGKADAEKEGRSRLDTVIKLLRIEDKLDRKPVELSGGEQQRVAIARAIANHPAILLADEPTGALDSKNSEIVLGMFRELNATFKQTVILVTHNAELAARADRLIEMRDGLVVRDTRGNGGPS